MGLCALSLLSTVLVLNFHHHSTDKEMPNWVRKVVFGILAKMVCQQNVSAAKGSDVDPMASDKELMKSLESVRSSDGLKIDKKSNIDSMNEMSEILAHLRVITSNIQNKEKDSVILDDWRTAAKIVDRFCFLITCVSTLFFSVLILGLYPLGKTYVA